MILSQDRSTPTVAVDVWYHVGSKNETPGRTGFAHLFEHVMFTGSGHVPYGMHDRYTEGVGGANNGSTTNDRTNYFEMVPSNYLEDALWLESDRMGWLLDALDVDKLNAQRDIVKNERRQSYDNRPYGRAGEIISAALYPDDNPYHWPVIGSMEDLSAASAEDVENFFRLYYAPNNATLVIVGDFDPARAKAWVEKYFGEIPRGRPVPTAGRAHRHAHGREAAGLRGPGAGPPTVPDAGPRSASTARTATPWTSWATSSRDPAPRASRRGSSTTGRARPTSSRGSGRWRPSASSR